MRPRRFVTRVFASLFAVGLLTAFAVSWIDDRAFQGGARSLLERELDQQALVLEVIARAALADPDKVPALRERVSGLGAASDVRFTVIADDGRVLAESDEDPEQLDDHSQRPEVVAARAHGIGTSRRHSASIGRELVYLARAVRGDGGGLLGVVRVARAASSVDEVLTSGRQRVWLALVVGLGVAGGLAMLLARRLTRPIGELRAAAQAMAAGSENARAVVDGDVEVAELGRALNTLADRVQQRVEEMRGERAKLSAILGGMVEGVAAVDEQEHLLHLNGAAADMLGVTAKETVGRPLVEIAPAIEICELVTATLRSGDKASRETALRKGADIRTVQVEAAPLRDGDGAVRGAVLVLHDVTELRRLENMRRDFVANVSHELKTPLTAIKGMVDTMVDDTAMPASTRTRFLEKVQRQADRLGNLVSDLLVLARIESPRPGDEMLPIDVRLPIRESCSHLAAAAQQKQIDLRVSLPPEPVTVRGESESLRQVVDNLLGNAIRYTPAQGAVDVSLVRQNGEAVLAVRDTGIGIAAEHIDRIFERFYRVDKARSRELGGTGLGLAIVKHIALLHGGAVSVHSRVGHGSVFTVRIPLHEEAAESAARDPS